MGAAGVPRGWVALNHPLGLLALQEAQFSQGTKALVPVQEKPFLYHLHSTRQGPGNVLNALLILTRSLNYEVRAINVLLPQTWGSGLELEWQLSPSPSQWNDGSEHSPESTAEPGSARGISAARSGMCFLLTAHRAPPSPWLSTGLEENAALATPSWAL